MRLIDADALYERLKADEELARNRVIDTPSSFPNGAVNPFAIRYMAQLNERTRFKEIVFDAPTIEERKTGKWIHGREIARTMFGDKLMEIDYEGWSCSICGCCCEDWRQKPTYNFCPNCGARMERDYENKGDDD